MNLFSVKKLLKETSGTMKKIHPVAYVPCVRALKTPKPVRASRNLLFSQGLLVELKGRRFFNLQA